MIRKNMDEKLKSTVPITEKLWRIADNKNPKEFCYEGIITDIDSSYNEEIPCTIARVNYHLEEADEIEKRIVSCHNACIDMKDPGKEIAKIKEELEILRLAVYESDPHVRTLFQLKAIKMFKKEN